MGWEPWFPYQFENDNNQLTGLDVDLMVAIVKQMGYELIVKKLAWKHQLRSIDLGNLDFSPGASKTPEREKFAYFSSPYRTESVKMFIKKGVAKEYPFKKLSDLVGTKFKLGVTRDYYYGEDFKILNDDKEFQKRLRWSTNDGLNYKKIVNNAIDGCLADYFSALGTIKQEGYMDQIEIHPIKIYETDIHVMFSKISTSPKIVTAFNQALEEIKKNGIYDQIVDKYLNKNSNPK